MPRPLNKVWLSLWAQLALTDPAWSRSGCCQSGFYKWLISKNWRTKILIECTESKEFWILFEWNLWKISLLQICFRLTRQSPGLMSETFSSVMCQFSKNFAQQQNILESCLVSTLNSLSEWHTVQTFLLHNFKENIFTVCRQAASVLQLRVSGECQLTCFSCLWSFSLRWCNIVPDSGKDEIISFLSL